LHARERELRTAQVERELSREEVGETADRLAFAEREVAALRRRPGEAQGDTDARAREAEELRGRVADAQRTVRTPMEAARGAIAGARWAVAGASGELQRGRERAEDLQAGLSRVSARLEEMAGAKAAVEAELSATLEKVGRRKAEKQDCDRVRVELAEKT